MKVLLITTILFSLYQICLCQVTGCVVNVNGQPIPLADITLVKPGDTAFTKSTVTNNKGAFKFVNIIPGSYTLSYSCIGYQNIQSPLLIVSAGGKDVGTAVMKEETKQLSGVVVRSQKPLYQQQPEGIVVNVESSVLTKGSSILAVLERSPGVTIDHHNNSIALNGKTGVIVMINGKLMRMSMEQLINLLNGMSADDIATIELLTTPGAKYDAEGSAGIINIVLKKDKALGTNGGINITGGYGYREKASANARIDHNNGKTDIYGSYSFSHNRSYGMLYGNGSENVPALGGEASFDYHGTGKPVSNSHFARAGIDYKAEPGLTLGAGISYDNSVTENNSHNRCDYTLSADSVLYFNGYIQGISHWQNLIASIYLEKQWKQAGKINVDADYLQYNITSPTTVQGSFIDKNGNSAKVSRDSLFSPTQNAYGNAVIQVGVLKIDYEKQFGKNLKLEAGAKGTYTKSTSLSGIESFINGQWVSPAETANNIVMKEGIAAAYASLNIQVNASTSITAGTRYEYYDTRANNNQTGSIAFKRNLGQLFPSLFASKKLNDNSSLQFSYTKRITRPSYNDLASYVAYNDPLSVFTGNPLLKPTITHNLKMGYSYNRYIFSLLLSRDDNVIAAGQVTSSPSGYIVYISPQNITWQNSIMLQTIVPVKINTWWAMNYTFTGGWHQYKMDYTPQPVVISYWGAGINTTQTFTLRRGFSAELSGAYNSSSYFANGKSQPNGYINMGFKKELSNNKGSFQLSVADVLISNIFKNYIGGFARLAFDTKAYIEWHGESTKFPIIKLTYSRSFGKNQQKERKNSVSDEEGRVK